MEKLSKRRGERELELITQFHLRLRFFSPEFTFNSLITSSSRLIQGHGANTWQLLNKFIIRLDARVRDSEAGAPCFFQYIRAAIYSLQIVPNWQPGRHARVCTTFVQPWRPYTRAHTHTHAHEMMGASTNDTPSSLTGWLSAHPLINWLHAPRPCVQHRCNTRVYSQMYIRYNLPCSRFEHPCSSFIKRRFNCKSIPSSLPTSLESEMGAPMTFGQPPPSPPSTSNMYAEVIYIYVGLLL